MDLDLLRTVTILRDLNDEELAAFWKLFTIREVRSKERLLEEGSDVSHFCIICSGVLHIRRLANKREMLIGRLGVGSYYGEINYFDPGVATASIYAMEPTVLAITDYDSLRAFMSANPLAGYKLVSRMMTETVRRLRATSNRLVHSVFWSTQGVGAS